MLTRSRNPVARVAAHVPGVLVLIGLGTIAVVGYLYDWKLPRLFGAAISSQSKESPPEADGDASSASHSIHLSGEAVRKSDILTAAVAERPIAQYIHAHGSFDYNQTHYARLGPRAAGVVWQIYRRPGDVVRRDELLAVVESAEVGRAKAAFLQSLVTADAKEQTLKGVQQASGSIPEWSLRETRAQAREARAHLFADQQALFNLGLPIAIDEEIKRLPEDEIMRRLRLLGLPQAIAYQLDPTTATANLLPVKSPIDGVVVGAAPALGEAASPERALFQIADLRTIWVTCEVRLEDVGLLTPGQEVFVRADGGAEDAPPGKLTWIAAEADEKTHTVQARAEVANPAGKLRPNTPFEGRILIRRNPHAIAVPSEAVQWDGRTSLVFVRVSEEEYEPRPVLLGIRESDFTEILSGVVAGEVVVTRGSHVLNAEQLKDRIGGDD